jgi:AhpD family alkylhydroperoxidase
MTDRINPFAAAPDLMKLLVGFGQAVVAEGLEPSLMELVKIRASQINGCAVCLSMHATEARRNGEREERLYMLDAWRESGLYTDRERAALAWTEALTRLTETRAPDADYAAVQAQFSDEEQARLTLLICVINSFNRVGVGYRMGPIAAAAQQAA